MPVKQSVLLTNWRGGLNTSVSRNRLSPGQFSQLTNWWLQGGKLRRRPRILGYALRAAGVNSLTDCPRTVQQLSLSTGSWAAIGLCGATLYQLGLNANSAALSDAMSLAFSTSATRWRSVQYKNYGYAVRPDLNYILRFNASTYWSTGIAAPSTNATGVTSATAGNVEAGDYYGVYTFVDADGVESPPSAVSAKWTQGASKKVDWSSVDVSTNPRVTKRYLYRTLPNQTGEYFYVGVINDNVTTTATEDTTVAQMGDLSPESTQVPPSVYYTDIETAYERLWGTDGSFLYGSYPEDPDNFDPSAIYQFSPDDGEPIKAIRRLGDKLLVWKSNSLWSLNLSLGEFEFLPRVVDERNGTITTFSVCTAEGLAFWYSGKAVFVSDGNSPGVDISTGVVSELADITAGNAVLVSAAINPRLGWYMLACYDSVNSYQRVFVYNYREKYWFELDYGGGPAFANYSLTRALTYDPPGGTPRFTTCSMAVITYLNSYIDSNGLPGVFMGMAATAGTYESGLFDVFVTAESDSIPARGGPDGGVGSLGSTRIDISGAQDGRIPCLARFAGTDFQGKGATHSLDRILIQSNNPVNDGGSDPQTALTASIVAYSDFSSYTKSRSVTISQDRAWKNFKLSTASRRSSLTEVGIAYIAGAELAIDSLEMHGDLWAQLVTE